MTHPKEAQAKYTHGRWQAGRLRFPGRGADRADEWVVDVVVVEEAEDEDLRALGRYRPAREMAPDLGPVMERAIREPFDGRPHLPAIVRVATAELAEEIRRQRPELRISIGPTPLVATLGRDRAEELLPDEGHEDTWHWLEGEVTVALATRLFAAFEAFSRSLAWEALPAEQLVRLSVPALGLTPGWVNVLPSLSAAGGLLLSVGIAPDVATRQAWQDQSPADRQIAIFGVEQDGLPKAAFDELRTHGWQPSLGLYPRVVVGDGDDENPPKAREQEIAICALRAIARHFDRAKSEDAPGAPEASTPSDGPEATLTIDEADVILLAEDEDDEDMGASEFIVPGSPEHEDHRFLELDAAASWSPAPPPTPATVRATPKPGRNDPCWCGSGKKYKKCHLDADHGAP